MPAKKRKPTEAEIDRMRRLGTILRNSGAELEQARAESLDTLDARLREYGIDPERYDAWDRLEIASGILDDKPGQLTLREILNRLEGRAAAGELQAASIPEIAEVAPPPPRRKTRRSPNELNGQMLDRIHRDPEARGWSSLKWAKELACWPSQITAQPAWEGLAEVRQIEQIRRRKDRMRSGKTK